MQCWYELKLISDILMVFERQLFFEWLYLKPVDCVPTTDTQYTWHNGLSGRCKNACELVNQSDVKMFRLFSSYISQFISKVFLWNFSMMTSPNWNIFRVTDHLCGEFTGPGEFPSQRPVTRRFDVSFDIRLGKQSWGWWLETLSL